MAGSALKIDQQGDGEPRPRRSGRHQGSRASCSRARSRCRWSIGFVNAEMMLLERVAGRRDAREHRHYGHGLAALPVDQFGLPLAGICAIVYCLSKRGRVKYAALACLGLGLVFFGLFAMKARSRRHIDNADVTFSDISAWTVFYRICSSRLSRALSLRRCSARA